MLASARQRREFFITVELTRNGLTTVRSSNEEPEDKGSRERGREREHSQRN